jgi:predicted ribosomally synthesized peptide with SipW-like signal peptide
MAKHASTATTGGLTTKRKVLASVGILGCTSLIAAAGTFASFSDSQDITQDVAAATLDLIVNGSQAAPVLDVVSNAQPTDTWQRKVTVQRTGNAEINGLFFDATAAGDLAGALEFGVKECNIAWTAGGEPNTYTCSGEGAVETTPLAAGATYPVAAHPLGPIAEGQERYFLVVAEFPSTGTVEGDNALKGTSADLTYTFSATTVAGRNA